MSPLTILHIANLQAFQACAEPWDDLWRRSLVSQPTAQSSLISLWLNHFGQAERFQAVVVSHRGRFVGGIPLVRRRKGRLMPCYDIPGNEWSSAGQLLLDPGADMPAVCHLLLGGLSEINRSAYWFASVPLLAPWWQQLQAAAKRVGWHVDARVRYQVAQLVLSDSWARQQATMSRGLRKQLNRAMRRLAPSGQLELDLRVPDSSEDTTRLLGDGLQLEHAGWKGTAGTSLLAHDQAAQFVRQQASQLAERGQLTLAFLRLDGRPIAFECGWLAKQVYHSYKIGYAPEYRRSGPGHLLLYLLLQRFHVGGEARVIDFLGPLDDAVRRCAPACYGMGRFLLAPPRPWGQALAFAARHLLSGEYLEELV